MATGDKKKHVDKQIEELKEEELLELIRDTVGQLNALGDKLENYAASTTFKGDHRG